jgi:hypothetical protein
MVSAGRKDKTTVAWLAYGEDGSTLFGRLSEEPGTEAPDDGAARRFVPLPSAGLDEGEAPRIQSFFYFPTRNEGFHRTEHLRLREPRSGD